MSRSPVLDYATSHPIPVYVPPVPVTTSDIFLLAENGDVITAETGHVIVEETITT